MRKTIIAAVMALICTALFAQNEADFTVTLTNDGTGAVITGYTGRTAQVRIPATIQGMPVREIRMQAFYKNTTITSVVIPQGVTSIGFCAFKDASRLVSVTIPESVTKIAGGAFNGASSLVSVTIPEGITEIIKGGDSPLGMFEDCVSLTTVNLPSTLTSIGDYAFRGCTALTAITLPVSLKGIGYHAFGFCTALTTVTIPNSLEHIGYNGNAFYGCSRLTLATQALLRQRGYQGNF